MTELTVGTTLDNGQLFEYPLITPNQGFQDLSNVVMGGVPTREMYQKALDFAIRQSLSGKKKYAD